MCHFQKTAGRWFVDESMKVRLTAESLFLRGYTVAH